jgi:hypothetical protein
VLLLLLWRQRWLRCKRYLLRWLLRWLLLLLRWLLLLWRKVNMWLLLLLLLRWWLLLRWCRWKRILWRWLNVNHLMTPVGVSMAEHFRCLEHNAHNGEVLVVVVTICTQPTLKKIISLEQNLNECRVLITGERERVNLSSWADVCKVRKRT